ncbi:electron transfer flavoprotein subunit beta/FixA family protein [Deltaproteobacteria bacterium]|nr:electron transfer flavoprotein subunit beta/FixA family protein [Deltaproteobacteria bacterium]
MNIVVCVKRVPQVQEVDLEIDASGKDVKKGSLAYFINEWDSYAIEESVRMKEQFGGTVTAITIGNEDDEEVLRRCLAIGADRALRIDLGVLVPDAYIISRTLAEVIKDLEYDLILAGVQADDVNNGMVGIMLAEHLGVEHSAVVAGITAEGDGAIIRTELEDGIDEIAKISFPALLTIQTGINEPRYVSIMGIRKASKKELNVIKLEELNLSREDLSQRTIIEKLFLPPETEGAQMIDGDPAMIAEQIIGIMKEKGVNL